MNVHRFFAAVAIGCCFFGAHGGSASEARLAYEQIVREISPRSLQRTLIGLSSQPRFGTGLKTMGFEWTAETYDLVMPDPNATARLSCGSRTVRLFPLWPNGVQTSACDMTAQIEDCGDGSFDAIRGKRLREKIVILDFNSGSNWRECMRLGAKAVVFRWPDDTMRGEGESKWTTLPVDVPRFIVQKKDEPILNALIGSQVRLECDQKLIDAKAANYYLKIPGVDPELKNEWVMLTAYSDTMSVVPGLPHGADQSCGLSAMLELRKLLAKHPPGRSVLLVVTSGHFLAFQGLKEFIEKRFKDDWAIIGNHAPQFSATLDLSSGSSAVCSTAQGWWDDYRDENKDLERAVARTLGSRVAEIANVQRLAAKQVYFDGVNDPDGRDWRNVIPGRFACEAEILNQAGQNAITFAALEDSRSYQDTPLDTPDRVNFANLAVSTRTIACFVHHLTNDTQDESRSSGFVMPFRHGGTMSRLSFTAGFGTVSGQVLRYRSSRGFLPDEPVPGAIVTLENTYPTYMGVRGLEMVRASQGDARYRLLGVPPATCWEPAKRVMKFAWAYALDDRSRIALALDVSQSYRSGYLPFFSMNTAYMELPLVVFPCAVYLITGTTDPQLMKPLDSYYLMDARSHGYPKSGSWLMRFGDFKYRAAADDCAALFVDPNDPFDLTGRIGNSGARLALTHSTPSVPAGEGYSGNNFPASGRLDAPLATAWDLWLLDDWRLSRLRKHHIANPGIERLHLQTQRLLQQAEDERTAGSDLESQRYATQAWGLALTTHPMILSATQDVLNGLLFYMALLLPASYFLERLLFASKTIAKQLALCFGLFVMFFGLLRALHPAFDLTDSSFIIFVAFALGALSMIVMVFVVGKFESSLQEVGRMREEGQSDRKAAKLGLFFTALAIGVSNMRRRKARTILTAVSVVIAAFACLSFASVESDVRFNAVPAPGTPRYHGILFRSYGLDPLDESAFRMIQTEFGGQAAVGKRAWFYGGETSSFSVVTVRNGSRSVEAAAILGLDPQESQITRPQTALQPNGRWFSKDDRKCVILPSSVASQLAIAAADVGSAKVKIAGVEFKVIGIADDARLKTVFDLDNEPLMPADFRASDRLKTIGRAGGLAFRKYVRLDPSSVVMMPASTAIAIGADIRNVAVSFESDEQTAGALQALLPRTGINLYASSGGGIKRFSAVAGTSGRGFEYLVLPLLIAGIMVLNTMITSVVERRSEIAILSSIGLSPKQISALFFAESLVYAIIGSVVGYIGAQIVARYVGGSALFAGLNLNYSSLTGLAAVAMVSGVVLASTFFPAKIAARIATPASESDWRTATPEGDEWMISLPFTVSKDQARGLCEFYHRWFSAHNAYSIGAYVSEDSQTRLEDARFVTSARCWLRPFDLGVQQMVELSFQTAGDPSIYQVLVRLRRVSGDPDHWVNVNRPFLADLRQQFLVWRTLNQAAGEQALPEKT